MPSARVSGLQGARVVALLALALGPRLAQAAESQRLLILGALARETEPIAAELAERTSILVLGLPAIEGKLDGRSVVVATTGVGKVNAAMTTSLLVERYSPAAVLFTGIAGALDPQLDPGDVVIGETLVQHDLVNHTETGSVLRSVRNPRDGIEIPILLEASPGLVALARQVARREALEPIPSQTGPRAPRVRVGTIATGDSFVGSQARKAELRALTGADAVEMEGAAVAQVCFQQGVPFLVVRGLSDRAGNEARSEAQRYLGIAAGNAARIALAVARQLGVQQPEAER